jgi:polyisoprenoid-binding protein YceI
VTFTVKYLGYGADHAKGKRAGFHAETKINRTDFGVSYPGKTPDGRTIIGDDVELILELEAVEKLPAEATPAK